MSNPVIDVNAGGVSYLCNHVTYSHGKRCENMAVACAVSALRIFPLSDYDKKYRPYTKRRVKRVDDLHVCAKHKRLYPKTIWYKPDAYLIVTTEAVLTDQWRADEIT